MRRGCGVAAAAAAAVLPLVAVVVVVVATHGAPRGDNLLSQVAARRYRVGEEKYLGEEKHLGEEKYLRSKGAVILLVFDCTH